VGGAGRGVVGERLGTAEGVGDAGGLEGPLEGDDLLVEQHAEPGAA